MPSEEQRSLLQHPADAHGVVLAGPGTGKSTTVLQLVGRLAESSPDIKVRVITFTRAATAELVAKIRDEGGGLIEPVTVHSFALSLLMSHQELVDLPAPLRIPDDWEAKTLVRPDLSRRLKNMNFTAATPTIVGKLEREMAAGWDRLDPGAVLLSEIDPGLRNAYRASWARHRTVFGYSLFAEMPFRAKEMLEDHPVRPEDVDLLIVDEYQDLNKCDIGLMQIIGSKGVAILAVGDEDQSIYSFRGAAPHGILEFATSRAFPDSRTYTLTTSFRCGTTILNAARELIESSPTRAPKPPLTPGPGNPAGLVAYLRFASEDLERSGVVRLIKHLRDRQGVDPDQLVVMVRGDANHSWSRPLRDELVAAGIPAVDVEAALEPIATDTARRALAIARVCDNIEDELAWWTLLKLTRGVADSLVTAVADAAYENGERFSSRLLRLATAPVDGVSTTSHRRATEMIREILRIQEIAQGLAPPDEGSANGWADWIMRLAELVGMTLEDQFVTALTAAGAVTPIANGLRHFLNQLEPVTKDLALEEPNVAIMSMMRSKGLTRRAAIVMGVEEGIVPRPGVEDPEEERRLLYVAMTRAREFLYLTMATSRSGPTAFAGGGQAGTSRSRSPYFSGSSLQPEPGAGYLSSLGA